jgi:hypothetical protein
MKRETTFKEVHSQDETGRKGQLPLSEVATICLVAITAVARTLSTGVVANGRSRSPTPGALVPGAA